MRQKLKEKCTPEFEYVRVSYVCPECRKRGETSLLYMPDNLKAKLEKGRWCNCGARHKLTYKIYKKKNEEIVLKVVEFLSNEEVKPKKFRQLN